MKTFTMGAMRLTVFPIGAAALMTFGLAAADAAVTNDSITTAVQTMKAPLLQVAPEKTLHDLSQVPKGLGRKLTAMDERIDKALPKAEKALKAFLEKEKEMKFGESFQYLSEGLKEQFLLDPTNQGYIEQVRLYLDPPEQPTDEQSRRIQQVKAMINAGGLDVETDDPAMWAYQWSHMKGSADARFEATGPFARDFRLLDCQVVRLIMVSEDIAVAWVDESVEMPVALLVGRISQYLMRRENGEFRVWGQRTLDGPRIVSWVGRNTYVWPDQLELMPEDTTGF